jgi:copper(I)-binding protein
MRKLFIAMTVFCVLACDAAAQTGASIHVEDAWARATPASARAAAIYFKVTDTGSPDRLVEVSTPVAAKAELHETIHEGNVMKMRPVAGLAISAGSPVSLAPGGYHIMLTELKQPLTGGESFPLSLRFEKAGTIETTVTVRPVGAGAATTGAAMNMGGAGNLGGAGHDMTPMGMPGMNKP